MTLEHPTQHCQSRYFSPPPQLRNYRRTEVIVEAFEGAVSKRWGTTKTRRNHTVIAIVQALAGLPTFAAGGRAAYPAEKLARRCRRHVRTVEDALAKLREFPELVRVVFVRKGEPDWRGVDSRLAHLEFQVGPVLQGLIEHPATAVDGTRVCDAPSGAGFPCVTDAECTGNLPTSDTVAAIVCGQTNRIGVALSGVPGVTASSPPCEAGSPPGLTPGDLNLALPTDLELPLKSAPASDTRETHLNFENQSSGRIPTPPTDAERSSLPSTQTVTDHPPAASPPRYSSELPLTPPTAATAARTEPPIPYRAERLGWRNKPPLIPRSSGSETHRRRSERRSPATALAHAEPALELRLPCWLLEAVIRQHRAIAEGKGPRVPIDDRDRARVDGALGGLSGRWEDDALLKLCARVSYAALREARAKGGTVANLRYTFGGPDEEPQEPHKHFHRRVAELREDDEKAARERLDGELTAALLGTPKPPVKASIRQQSGPPSSMTSTRLGSRAQPTLTTAQQAALNAEYSEAIRRNLRGGAARAS